MTTCLAKTKKKDRKITISTATETQDDLGNVSKSWNALGQPWAEVEHLDGTRSEVLTVSQELAEAETAFTIRYSDTLRSVSARHQVTFDGNWFDVIGAFPKPAGRPRNILIYAKRRRDGPPRGILTDQNGNPILDQNGNFIAV